MLKIVHINREAPAPKPDPVKELAEILRAKWEIRDKEEAKKMFPQATWDDDELNPTA